jgi:phosphoadenosine phosphosulfate reductase family protein
MAIVKEDCDSFDIMPLKVAEEAGKRIFKTTSKIDVFLASFSGGKDSQVILDLCTRALLPSTFQVVYSDTGYELPHSLKLYEEVKEYYNEKYPELLFRTARNHEKVLNYWDKIGTPSDTHRWCCSVMKTAPLYRMLKIEGTNKQAKVLAFEGTRGEESNKRSTYERIGKGVKHNGVINARPIYFWSSTEVYLYLFLNKLPINPAYRFGKPRVGCLICPFSSEWDDMIVNKCYPNEVAPFVERIVSYAKARNIPNMDEYVKGHKWKLRASGKFMDVNPSITFEQKKTDLKVKIERSALRPETWIPVLGKCTLSERNHILYGELRNKTDVYPFEIKTLGNDKYEVDFHNLKDVVYTSHIKKALYKSTYCINCEVCEVECPTGALSVYPKVKIETSKCIHCLKCLTFHNKGCIVADSLDMAQKENLKLTGISGYGTFGLREEWLESYMIEKEEFLSGSTLGTKQKPSLKSWLKDSEIIDKAGKETEMGNYLSQIKDDMPTLVWEIIWINLCNISPLVKWFITNVDSGSIYSKAILKTKYEDQYQEGLTTFSYSLDALFNTFTSSPIGGEFNQKSDISKTEFIRGNYNDLSEYALIYSLYRYAEITGQYTFRVSDLYDNTIQNGIVKEFGIDRQSLVKLLRTLNSSSNRLLVAELNMGLEHITLKEDITAFEALKMTVNY